MNKLFGTKIRIHPVFWLVLGAGILTGHFWEVATVFFIVIVHECGHTFMALRFGWRLTSIEILPFGGVAKVDEHGTRSLKEEWWVTIAGPLQHLWLPAVSYLLLYTSFWNLENHRLFLERNWMILAFNLLPVWPLDGGKILLLLLSLRYPYQKAYRYALILSSSFLLVMTTWVILHTSFLLNYTVIAIFLVFSIYKEWKQQQYIFMRFLLERWHSKEKTKKRLKDITVTPDFIPMKVFGEFYRGATHRIYINGPDQRKVIDEKMLLDAYFSGKLTGKPVGDLFT